MSRWFSVMWAPKLLLLPVKIRIFGPKTAFFAPKYAFFGTYLGLAGLFGALLVGWLVVVSRKTPIYFID